jgi:hypothetical protein
MRGRGSLLGSGLAAFAAAAALGAVPMGPARDPVPVEPELPPDLRDKRSKAQQERDRRRWDKPRDPNKRHRRV